MQKHYSYHIKMNNAADVSAYLSSFNGESSHGNFESFLYKYL